MKRCFSLLVTREMQIKATARYHFTLTRVAIILFSFQNDEELKKLEPLYTTGKNIKWQSCYRKIGSSSKVKHNFYVVFNFG